MAIDAINLWNADLLRDLVRSKSGLHHFLMELTTQDMMHRLAKSFDVVPINSDVIDQASSDEQIRGFELTRIWVDELAPGFNVRPPVAAFRDPRFPDADVTIEEEILDKHHPLNPNPQGGNLTQWVIVAGGKRSKPLRALAVAKVAAKALHERLIDALIDEAKERMPTYGAFG